MGIPHSQLNWAKKVFGLNSALINLEVKICHILNLLNLIGLERYKKTISGTLSLSGDPWAKYFEI